MKKLSSILILLLLSTIAFCEPGDIIKVPGKTTYDICDVIHDKMNEEFHAQTVKDMTGKNVYSLFDYSTDDYTISYEIFFTVRDGEFFYYMKYNIASSIDVYDYEANDKMYVIINQDIAYIENFIEHMF